MSEHVLKGELTGPINLSPGGDWRLVKSATVTSEGSHCLANHATLTQTLDLRINGAVKSDDVGLSLWSKSALNSDVSIAISASASVSAIWAVLCSRLANLDIVIKGKVSGDYYGLIFGGNQWTGCQFRGD
ncbi:MAG: hypothetical protein GJ676_03705 [Rhodobacteraceae bacterium]|nr:hypothetical protein [Paracoccaceae bacterium]